MVVPGFSVNDLINGIDWVIKSIIEVKQVPNEVNELRKDLEKVRGHLLALEQLPQVHQSVSPHTAASLNNLRADLHQILNDSICILKRLHPADPSDSGFFSNFKQKLRWMVDKRYKGSVKELEGKISKNNEEILLQLAFERREIDAQSARNNGPPPSLQSAQPNTLSATSTPSTGDERSVLSTSKSFPIQVQPQPCIPVRRPPSAPHSAPLGPPSTKSDPCRQKIDGASLPCTPSRCSTGKTTLCASDNHNARSNTSMSRASTMSPSQSAWTLEVLACRGTVKVWFESENPNMPQSHTVESVGIWRDGAGWFRGIKVTRTDGDFFEDEISLHWSNVTKHPLPVHEERTREIRDSDDQAKKFIRFIRLTKEPVIPKYYSFSDDEDYRTFQSKIVGKSLLFLAEVSSICSARDKTTPLCEDQVIQVWEDNGVRSIQFFRNGKDDLYSQHLVSSLRVAKSISNGLKLVFVVSAGTQPGDSGSVPEDEQIMKHLHIVFTHPRDMTQFLAKARFEELESQSRAPKVWKLC